jgi:hypothetical protein
MMSQMSQCKNNMCFALDRIHPYKKISTLRFILYKLQIDYPSSLYDFVYSIDFVSSWNI